MRTVLRNLSKVYHPRLSRHQALNIKNIFIKLQFSPNIMVNEVKTPIQNYFEKVLYENLTF